MAAKKNRLESKATAAPEQGRGVWPGSARDWYQRALSLAVERESAICLAGFLVLALASALWLFHEGRGLTFFNDDWSVVFFGQGSFDFVLQPHNGHIEVVVATIFKVLFHTAGLSHYSAYRAVVIVLHLAACSLVYLYARQRVGAVAALAPVTVLLFLGAGAEDLLWPSSMGFVGALATGLAALMLLERHSLAARIGTCALLILSTGFGELGLSFLLAVIVLIVAKRRYRQDLWIPLVPAALFALWYLAYNHDRAAITFSNFTQTPAYVANAIIGSVGVVVGPGGDWGSVAAVALGFFVVRRLLQTERDNALLWALVLGAGAFWVPIALTRANVASPGSSRYAYVGAFLVVLIALELVAGSRPKPPAIGFLAFATVAIVIANTPFFFHFRDFLRTNSSYARAELGAAEIARPSVSPQFVYWDRSHYLRFNAGTYLRAVDRYGSPAYSPAQIAALPEPLRLAADEVLVKALPVHAAVVRAAQSAAKSCRPVNARPSRPQVVDLPSGGLIVRAGSQAVTVRARRFSQEGGVDLATLHPGEQVEVAAPRDLSSAPWRIVTASKSSFSVCPDGA